MRMAGAPEFRRGALREFCNHAGPERQSARVPLGNANDPSTGKTIPKQDGRPAPQAGTPVATKNEELGDIEDLRVFGRR
jgi:hypothetical protein